MVSVVDVDKLPLGFPTHRHEPGFWEWLGRTVATYGFLEEVLGKAIFSFSATTPYPEQEIEEAYAAWLPKLERALSDPLGNLIDGYSKAVRGHPGATITNLEELVGDLRKAAVVRNVLCHGSWRLPDDDGASKLLFVNRQLEIFDSAVDVKFLQKTQRHVAELSCAVVSTVTHMGWRFPGSTGPGASII
ncbi:MAG: hypothetical protein AAFY80_02055 [Pseudomonadota bacterium]